MTITRILAALQESLLVIETTRDGWKISEHLKQCKPIAVAFDPQNLERAYCGTFDQGLWKSDDQGQTWEKIILNDPSFNITSVSVSQIGNRNKGFSKLFVGTEPSMIYSSSDGGQKWEKEDGFINLKSSPTWSFPPRPWTHHVRWIEPDKNNDALLFVAIEAGALIKSNDGGLTWIDRKKNGPYDSHTIRTHKKSPQKLYSAAGDGYFESSDYGDSWENHDDGLDNHTYLFGMAINSIDPQNLIVSAAANALKSHYTRDAESFIYQRIGEDHSDRWQLITNGLPESKGTVISLIESNPNVGDEFYCLNNRGIYCSTDSGFSWKVLDIPWSKEYLLQHPWALAVHNK